MKITAFDKDINYALDCMIQAKKNEWEPVKQKIDEVKVEIGGLIASKEFLEKLNDDNAAIQIPLLTTRLEEVKKEYHELIDANQPLADKLNKEIAILEGLKRNY